MGYSVYDLFDEHLKDKKDFDEFLESFKDAYYHNDVKAAYFVSSLLKIMGDDDFLRGIQDVIINSFEDYQDVFIIATKNNHDIRILGDLPEKMKLQMINGDIVREKMEDFD